MRKEDFSQLQIKEKEARVKEIHREIEALQRLNMNETQMNHLLSLVNELKELENIPEFDTKEGWKKFKRDYLPDIEKFKENEYYAKQQKLKYQKFIFKRIISIVTALIFTFILAGVVIGRTGFVNYFSRNTQGTEAISNKSSEEIQKDLEKEYKTLEKEYGVKIAKLNLPADEYTLQDYTLSEKYVSVVYLNTNKKENIILYFFKDKEVSGKINIENTTITTPYIYKDITYNIIENMERYYTSWEKQGIYYILQNCSSIEECKEIIQSIAY